MALFLCRSFSLQPFICIVSLEKSGDFFMTAVIGAGLSLKYI